MPPRPLIRVFAFLDPMRSRGLRPEAWLRPEPCQLFGWQAKPLAEHMFGGQMESFVQAFWCMRHGVAHAGSES